MIDDDLAKEFSDLIIEVKMHDNCFDVAKNKNAILTFEKGWKFKTRRLAETSVTRKKSRNVFKSCPKMISLEKLKIFTLLQKFP